MLILYSFTVNTETQEGALAGNVSPEEALQALQSLVIAAAIQRAKETEGKEQEETPPA